MNGNYSLRDFFAYLIPGIISLMVLDQLVFHDGLAMRRSVPLDMGFKDSVAFIALGFVLGYIQAQIPFILFNEIYSKGFDTKLFKMQRRTFSLSALTMSEGVKELVRKKMATAYPGAFSDKKPEFDSSNDAFFLCLSFVTQHAPEQALLHAQRLSAFALLDAVLWVPATLIVVACFNILFPVLLSSVLAVVVSAVLLRISFFFFCRHRADWIRYIYLQFAALGSAAGPEEVSLLVRNER